MDLTAAKSVLNRVAEQYKAAKELGEALETMTNLEQQQNTLTNNVANLLKEQTAQQTSLDAMKQEAVARLAQLQAEHTAKVSALSRQRDALMAQMQAEREATATSLTEQKVAAANAVATEQERLDSLVKQRNSLETTIATLKGQAEAIKSKMREFVS